MIEIPISVFISGVGILALWIIKEAFSDYKGMKKALNENTLAITKLTVEFNNFQKRTEKIPEMEKDLNALGSKVRGMEDKLKAT